MSPPVYSTDFFTNTALLGAGGYSGITIPENYVGVIRCATVAFIGGGGCLAIFGSADGKRWWSPRFGRGGSTQVWEGRVILAEGDILSVAVGTESGGVYVSCMGYLLASA